jgi:hypothetical protein
MPEGPTAIATLAKKKFDRHRVGKRVRTSRIDRPLGEVLWPPWPWPAMPIKLSVAVRGLGRVSRQTELRLDCHSPGPGCEYGMP